MENRKTWRKFVLFLVGASVATEGDLKYLYENHEDFAPIPSYFINPGLVAMMSGDIITKALNNDSINLASILHGEQYLEMVGDLPTDGILESEFTVKEVLDKGSGAAIVLNGKYCFCLMP